MAADLRVRAHPDSPGLDKGDIAARAPHIQGDEVAEAGLLADEPRRLYPGDRTGEENPHRLGLSPPAARGAGVRLHDLPVPLKAEPTALLLQLLEVVSDHRAQAGVHDGGRGALILAKLWKNLAGEGDRKVEGRRQVFTDPLFVRRVGVGEEEADSDRFDTLPGDLRGDPFHRRLVQLRDDPPLVVEPLGDLEPQVAGDDRLRAAHLKVVERGTVLTPDLDDIAEPLRGEKRGGSPPAFEQRVGRHGRAVNDPLDSPEVEPRLGLERAQPRPDPVGQPPERGGGLEENQAPLPGIEEHDVGERAADVYSDQHEKPTPNSADALPTAPPEPTGWYRGAMGRTRDEKNRLLAESCG